MKKSKIFSIILIALVYYVISKFIANDRYTDLIAIGFALLFAACIILKWEVLIFLFVIIFPTFQHISYFEIGFMDLNKFITVSLILSYFISKKTEFSHITPLSLYPFQLFVFWTLIFSQYWFIKGIFCGYYPYTNHFWIQFLVQLVNVIAIYLIIANMENPSVRKTVKFALLVGTLILAFSSIFSETLSYVGLIPRHIEQEVRLGLTTESAVRTSGIYSGHPTQFSALMATMFGYYISMLSISKLQKEKLFYSIIISFITLTFLSNPSRNGLFGCLAVLISMMFFERMNRSSFLFVFLPCLIFFVAYIFFGDFLAYRMSIQNVESQLHDSRLWLLRHFLSEIGNNLQILIYGSTNPFRLNTHNTYVEIIYKGGMPFFIVFFYLIQKILKNRSKANFNIYYPLIGALVPFAGNNNPIELYLVLILSLGFQCH